MTGRNYQCRRHRDEQGLRGNNMFGFFWVTPALSHFLHLQHQKRHRVLWHLPHSPLNFTTSSSWLHVCWSLINQKWKHLCRCTGPLTQIYGGSEEEKAANKNKHTKSVKSLGEKTFCLLSFSLHFDFLLVQTVKCTSLVWKRLSPSPDPAPPCTPVAPSLIKLQRVYQSPPFLFAELPSCHCVSLVPIECSIL